METTATKPDYDKLIDCAAIKMPDGRVWTGKRHHHCFATVIQALGWGSTKNAIQGFVAMSGRFLTREEAYELAVETGQIKKFVHAGELFSEDLY